MNSRTVFERKFKTDAKEWQLSLSAVRSFEATHTINPEFDGGFRAYIDQWPAWKYLVSIQTLRDGRAKGAIRAIPYNAKGAIYVRDFMLQDYEASVLLPSIDRNIDGFWGSRSNCTDGTLFQFERWKERRVASGEGNAACQLHYAELEAILGEALIVNLHDAPFEWRGWFYDKRYLELQGKGN